MDTYNRQSYGGGGAGGPDFWSVAPIGEPAPDFTLPDLDGRNVSLSHFRGKSHVILEFGSIT